MSEYKEILGYKCAVCGDEISTGLEHDPYGNVYVLIHPCKCASQQNNAVDADGRAINCCCLEGTICSYTQELCEKICTTD